MKRWLLLPLFCTIIAHTSFALNPPPATASFDRLGSTSLLSGAPAMSPSSLPSVSEINPAASALATLPSVSFDYLGLVDLATGVQYAGTGVAAAGLLPTGYGVYSGSARFLRGNPGMPYGTLGSVRLSLAKALYPNLLVGAGLGLIAGRGDHFDWGLGLNLGFLSLPGRLGPLRDFSWGAAINSVGKPYAPFSGYSSFPPAFTPTVGASFSLFKSEALSAGLSGDVSFPSFQDVRLGVGGSLTFGGSARLRLSASVDLHDLLSGTQPFPLAGGIGVTIIPGANSGAPHLRSVAAVRPVAANLYAAGVGIAATIGHKDTQPPTIAVHAPRVSYISPNGDGVKDNLRVPVTITDNRYVDGYQLTVRSSGGRVVRTIKSPSLAVTTGGSAGVMDRLLYVKQGVPVPPAIVWNGKNSAGRTVPDGRYTYTVSAWDENGNRSTSPAFTVVVDTKAPTINLTQPPGSPPIFSPNGNGYKDTLTIHQSGSKEPLWIGRFFNSSGRVVRTLEWHNSSPESFVWDGRGQGGKVLPDGAYRYEIAATDRAGNTASASISTIVIDTARPVVKLNVSRDAISPGTSSPKQTMRYLFEVPKKNEVVSWSLAISNASGAVVRSVGGGTTMPDSFTFDGTNQQGSALPDGVYHAKLSVVYRNGSHSSAEAAPVTIDRVAPSANVATAYHVFSPINGATHSTMIFTISASPERAWKGTIATGGGKPVKSYVWNGRPPARLSWNGRAADGKIEPDGIYQFSISATDEAGNFGQSNVVSFVLDTQHKQLLLSTNYQAFSPNGRRHIIRIIPQVRSPKGFQSYRIDIENHAGRVVGSFSGTGVPTGSFAWNGQGPGGQPVAQGRYRAVMTATYATGASVKAETPWFSVITTLPQLEVSAQYHLFSPNGDGHRDSVTFTQASRGGESWTGRIVAESGKTVVEKHWRGTLPASFTWNGRNMVGNVVANGSYTYELSASDAAGNTAQAQVSGIVVDNRATQVYIDAAQPGFSPNGDGIKDTMTLTTATKPPMKIASWRIEVLNGAGTVVKSWSGKESGPPASLQWDGSTAAGGVAPDGRYHATLLVRYLKGDVDHSTSEPFLLVAKAPTVHVAFSPLPLPPPGSKEAKPLGVRISTSSLDPIAHWKLQIYTPPVEEPFFAFTGQGAPPSVLHWDGRNASGTAVKPSSVYSYHLTVVDSLGNETLITGNIPIGP